jgi:hypothetical protein
MVNTGRLIRPISARSTLVARRVTQGATHDHSAQWRRALQEVFARADQQTQEPVQTGLRGSPRLDRSNEKKKGGAIDRTLKCTLGVRQ